MNLDIANAKPHVLAALRKANAVIGIGDVHGWPRPPAYVAALAMLNAAREAERLMPTLPPAPDKPKDVKKWIDATVEVRQQVIGRQEVTDELVLAWERETAAAGIAATASHADRLATVFDGLVEKFDAYADAPRTLTGHETPEERDAHMAVLRVASDLSNALMQRAQIGDAAEEAEDIGGDIVWLVLAPHAETTRDQVQDALRTFKGSVPQTLAEWDALRPLGLRLAQVGEVAARRQRHTDFMYKIGMSTPDMGMRDHTYGEIESDQAPSPNGRIMQAHTDALFERAPSMTLS